MGNELFTVERHETMSSLQIAEITGKEHKHIMRDIRELLNQGVDGSNFGLTSYIDKSNRAKSCYEVSKKGCLILASGYDALLREKIINRWEELENAKLQQSSVASLPQNYLEALKALVVSEEEKLVLQAQNEEQVNSFCFV